MEASQGIEELLVVLAIVGGLAVAYGKFFGPYQTEISQAVIDALQTARRLKRIVNLAVGILLATAFTLVGAAWIGEWKIVPAGVLAGILASVEATRKHDSPDGPDDIQAKPARKTEPDTEPRASPGGAGGGAGTRER